MRAIRLQWNTHPASVQREVKHERLIDLNRALRQGGEKGLEAFVSAFNSASGGWKHASVGTRGASQEICIVLSKKATQQL